jgi:hypothetical protein
MGSTLRYAIVILVGIVAIAGLAVCGDCFVDDCAHLCCTRSEAASPLGELLRRIVGALAVGVCAVFGWAADPRRSAAPRSEFAPWAAVFSATSALRI